jgi:hypothetical protein
MEKTIVTIGLLAFSSLAFSDSTLPLCFKVEIGEYISNVYNSTTPNKLTSSCIIPASFLNCQSGGIKTSGTAKEATAPPGYCMINNSFIDNNYSPENVCTNTSSGQLESGPNGGKLCYIK